MATGSTTTNLPSGESAFYRIAEMYFANRVDMEATLASLEGQEAFGDVAYFETDGLTATIVEDIQMVAGQEDASTPATFLRQGRLC